MDPPTVLAVDLLTPDQLGVLPIEKLQGKILVAHIGPANLFHNLLRRKGTRFPVDDLQQVLVILVQLQVKAFLPPVKRELNILATKKKCQRDLNIGRILISI